MRSTFLSFLSRRLPPASRLFLWGGVLLFLGVFFFYPLSRILAFSLAPGAGVDALDLPLVASVLAFSLYQALLSTLLTLALGLPAAYLFSRFLFPARSFLRLLMAIPFMLPTVVVAAGYNAWLGGRGWLNLLLMHLLGLDSPPIQFVGSLTAILLAHVFYNAIIVVRLVGNALAHLDPRLPAAARTMGASPLRTFLHLSLPLILPSILSAALLVFIFNFTSFGVILLLGGVQFATLEVEIYMQSMHYFNLPLSAWLAIIQLLCTLLFAIAYSRSSARLQAVSNPHPAHLNLRRPRRLAGHLLVGAFVVALLLFYLLPLVSLPMRSFTRLEADQGQRGEVTYALTTRYYSELFVNRSGSLFYVPPARALANSLGYAAVTMVLSLVLGYPAAAALARPGRIERWLDPLIMLPLGASAVTLGLGFLLSFGAWIASPALVPLAHTLIALPFVIRTLQPALAAIPDPLRQAARSLGASPLRLWVSVEWPLMRRPLLAAAVFAYTVSLGEFGATSILSRPEMPTLPVAIYRFLSQPGALNYGQAMAMATLLMLVCGAGIVLIEKLRLPSSGEF